jgi:hypothetical protein
MDMPGRAREVDTIINGELLARTLCVDARHSVACAELWATGRYNELRISEFENPGLKDIEFLSIFRKITYLHLMLDRKIDLSPLCQHANSLQGFSCNDGINGLKDCRPFTCLELWGQKYFPSMKFADTYPNLLGLCLSGKYTNLEALPRADNLKEISLPQTSIESLQGIERYPELEKVLIYQARKLHDISQLSKLKNLKEIDFDKCRCLVQGGFDWSCLHGLRKMVYMGCTAMPDLQFIREMPDLFWLVIMDTNVLDGDLNPVAEHPRLQHFVCTSYRHFTHTEAQLRKILTTRKSLCKCSIEREE